jgi:hypothetical protein
MMNRTLLQRIAELKAELASIPADARGALDFNRNQEQAARLLFDAEPVLRKAAEALRQMEVILKRAERESIDGLCVWHKLSPIDAAGAMITLREALAQLERTP